MKKISFINLKGGVGKTTVSVNVAVFLGKMGYRTLLIDLDPQSNATQYFDMYDIQKPSVYDLIIEDEKTEHIIQQTQYDNLALIPSVLSFADAEGKLLLDMKRPRETRLAEKLREIQGKYDFVLIDCAPSLSVVTTNAIMASDEVVIPLKIDGFAIEGLQHVNNTIDVLERGFSLPTIDRKIVITMYEGNTTMMKAFAEEVTSGVYKTKIRKAIAVGESTAQKQPMLYYDPKHEVTEDYRALAEEIAGE